MCENGNAPSDQQKFEVGAAILKAVPKAIKGLSKKEMQVLVGDQQSLTTVASKAMIEAIRTVLAAPMVKTKSLNFKQLLLWLRKNNLESKLLGGLEGQIAEQEKFYQKFYGGNFQINLKEIFVDTNRLPAIKAGLEADCLNYALLKFKLFGSQLTGAEYVFECIAKKLKSNGFKIWSETGTDRWTKLTLAELLRRCNPTEPEEFSPDALKKDWVAEVSRIVDLRGYASADKARIIELIFTSNLADIPNDQTIVNKDGEIVRPDDRSYVSAIAKKVRVLSHEEGIILASQLYVKNKTYLASNTWEWRRDLVDHRDKGTNLPVSVARAHSHDSVFYLHSDDASYSDGAHRLRLAL